MSWVFWNFLCLFLTQCLCSEVFLRPRDASQILSRHRRANSMFEEMKQGNMERECNEERCSYEEAREIFEDVKKTDEFWHVYFDGDACLSHPCLNGGACKDAVGPYTCYCQQGFKGYNCEIAIPKLCETENGGCDHFCKVKENNVACSCAKGYELADDGKSCISSESYKCGAIHPQKTRSIFLQLPGLTNIEDEMHAETTVASVVNTTNPPANETNSMFGMPDIIGEEEAVLPETSEGNTRIVNGVECPPGDCPWQALLINENNIGFCGGTILNQYFVLSAAHCMNQSLSTRVVLVFRSRRRANALLLRSRRANMFLLEEILPGNLERECIEERCSKEEAREYFENDQKTNDFWTKYYDGDQCSSSPCKHGGTCKDGIGGYTCTCSDMYGGSDCQTDKSQCPSAGPLACEHFCRPMAGTYRCFCTRGFTLQSNGRNCSPHVQNPCGTTEKSSFCPDGHCPWEVQFVNGSSDVICHGVIVGRKSVLTSAACMSALQKNVTLAVRDSSTALRVSSWTPHKRYASGPDNDLAFLELKEPFPEHMSVIPLCLPEKDYSENILMRAGREGMVMGGASHSYLSLDDCRDSINLTFLMTNKMFCMERRASSAPVRTKLMKCEVKSGSPVATVEGKTAFLTGLSLSVGGCDNRLVLTKLSRYLHWLRPLLHAAEKEQQ